MALGVFSTTHMVSELTDRLREYLAALPADSYETWAEACGVKATSAESARDRLNQLDGIDIQKQDGKWRNVGDRVVGNANKGSEQPTPDDDTSSLDLESINQGDDPDPNALTGRETYIVRELQTGTTVDELADDLNERESIVEQHLVNLKQEGWPVYIDSAAGMVTIESDQPLRSSEHTGTRTRKANRWWERRHNQLVREFRNLDTPDANARHTYANEDWVLHLTDIHAGDRVRTDDGTDIYSKHIVPEIVRYVTERSLKLADMHPAHYDTAHLLWGGDFITNEGIYSGQFEDLDAWLDEQHDTLADPLIEQVKAYSERFDTVNVVAQVGNHGKHRASGTSRQANADLILYKNLRNAIAAVRKHAEDDLFTNVNFQIGEAKAYKNFELRGGRVTGHLRHGQNRKPQAATAAGSRDWSRTLNDHGFDAAWMGHHHVSGRIPWDGPPIFVSGSPKPASDFVEQIAGRIEDKSNRQIAHCHGIADHGVTVTYPIKTHRFDYTSKG